MKKRLFFVAAFDPKNIHDGIIDDPLIIYVRELSKLGDVIFFQDNDVKKTELEKILPFVIYAHAERHSEYDFGSYKRGYFYARDNNLLDNYEWVYFVNDSIYAPLYPLQPIIEELESKNTDVVGMVYTIHKKKQLIQSWFFGMSRKIVMSEPFENFMASITKPRNKKGAYEYEDGFTALCLENKWNVGSAFSVHRREAYNNIKGLYCRGLPFMKNKIFVRKYGALSRQTLYVLDNISPELREAIIKHGEYLYGEKYISKFFTRNVLKILYRNIRYGLGRLFRGFRGLHKN